jgi:hypothetical protein
LTDGKKAVFVSLPNLWREKRSDDFQNNADFVFEFAFSSDQRILLSISSLVYSVLENDRRLAVHSSGGLGTVTVAPPGAKIEERAKTGLVSTEVRSFLFVSKTLLYRRCGTL